MDTAAIEERWRQRWDEMDLFRAEREDGRPKFFVIFAYPGISGYLHVGHMRGFTYTDVIARFRRQQGNNVLFPAGFHASGLPSVGLAKRVERGDENTLEYLRKNGTPEEIIPTLSDPVKVVDYFSTVYIEDYWKRFGFSIDYSRAINTISPSYKQFIRWQFQKLNDANLLITKPHFAPSCPADGPVAVDAAETDISRGGKAETLTFLTQKFRLDDGRILPCATLRPETVYGVTNLWVRPDEELVDISIDDEVWLVSQEAATKLAAQKENAEQGADRIATADLIGELVSHPALENPVPILPGPFVEHSVATGVVMSVPAHAPFDWAALSDLQRRDSETITALGLDPDTVAALAPISLIEVPGFNEFPAVEICEQMNISSQDQKDLLEEATAEIYKKEFHEGRLKSLYGGMAGKKVGEAKDPLIDEFQQKGWAAEMLEFSEPVVCRCGQAILIKRIPDQWFIKYSDEELTARAQEHAEKMTIVPQQFYRDFPSTLDWFADRACIRQGSWLGTEFPFKEDWIIEPISDSTIYPAAYVLARYVNSGALSPEQMTKAFFDHVLLDGGADGVEVEAELLARIRADFRYWYPLDINLGGKEHKTVHFPPFLMNHVAIFPPDRWPRGIFVNWWVTSGAGKISKSDEAARGKQHSKGGVQPIPEAIAQYGVDAMRLYYCHIGGTDTDIAWDQEAVARYKQRLLRIWDLTSQLGEKEVGTSPEGIDNWMLQTLALRTNGVLDALERYDLRGGANEAFFLLYSDIQWYLRRGGCSAEVLDSLVSNWLRLLHPFVPFMTQELWSRRSETQLIDELIGENRKIEREPLLGEVYLRATLEDLKEIQSLVREPISSAVLYVASPWKLNLHRRALDLIAASQDRRLDQGQLIRDAMGDSSLAEQKKNIPNYAKRLARDVNKIGSEELLRVDLDEVAILEGARAFLAAETGLEIAVFSDADKARPGEKKAGAAVPRRPGIFLS